MPHPCPPPGRQGTRRFTEELNCSLLNLGKGVSAGNTKNSKMSLVTTQSSATQSAGNSLTKQDQEWQVSVGSFRLATWRGSPISETCFLCPTLLTVSLMKYSSMVIYKPMSSCMVQLSKQLLRSLSRHFWCSRGQSRKEHSLFFPTRNSNSFHFLRLLSNFYMIMIIVQTLSYSALNVIS